MDAGCQAIASVSKVHSNENKYSVNLGLISAEIVLRASLYSLLSRTPNPGFWACQRHSSKPSRMPSLINWLLPHFLISVVGR